MDSRTDFDFDEALKNIRDIRLSSSKPSVKIAETIGNILPVTTNDVLKVLSQYQDMVSTPEFLNRLANYLIYHAVIWMESYKKVTMKDFELLFEDLNFDERYKQDIFSYPSFYGYSWGVGGEIFHLPEELDSFKGNSMALKIADMDKLMDTFNNRDTHYRRAYAILADLDKQILEGLEKDAFPYRIFVPYKDDGDAVFVFSHFEVDMREPDENFRTLYVVYRYDSSVSQ